MLLNAACRARFILFCCVCNSLYSLSPAACLNSRLALSICSATSARCVERIWQARPDADFKLGSVGASRWNFFWEVMCQAKVIRERPLAGTRRTPSCFGDSAPLRWSRSITSPADSELRFSVTIRSSVDSISGLPSPLLACALSRSPVSRFGVSSSGRSGSARCPTNPA